MQVILRARLVKEIEQDFLEVAVIDTGKGVAPAKRATIFDSESKGQMDGLGSALGLKSVSENAS